MSRLRVDVTVRRGGVLVVYRTVAMEHGRTLGEHAGSMVVFEGHDQEVRVVGAQWWVGDVELVPGLSAVWAADDVEVVIEPLGAVAPWWIRAVDAVSPVHLAVVTMVVVTAVAMAQLAKLRVVVGW